MQKINLYRYDETNGSVTVTPQKRNENDIPHKERLVADEGYVLTNGEVETICVDIDFEDDRKWIELEANDINNNFN